MANIKQQKKRNIQNEKNRSRNSKIKSSIRTSSKKLLKSLDLKDTPDIRVLQEIFKDFVKTIDTAARKGIIKKTTAARKKSRLACRINTTVKSIS